MQIVINGEAKEVACNLTVAALLQQMALQPLRVAVELNRLLLPRAQHSQTALAQGDVLEIVTLVGGG
ncbi:MAG TPA: sulfur carrier protein ThiS [Phycisphaerae bacterium]|nr:sulfur carrier protein ThiS [Phycisphaerae bacterium]